MSLDPITLEVIDNRLREIGTTMAHVLFHSGYSTILRESRDGSAGICNAAADAVIAAGTPVHLYPYHKSALAVLRTYGPDDVHPGDSFVLTDPYEAGTAHLPDMVVVTPVFVDGELFAFSASVAHKTDLGGLVPGSSGPGAREIYHEGLLLPAVRYATRDGIVKEIEAIVKRNSRAPDAVAGDIRSQLGCTRIGAERIVELSQEYGTDTIKEAMGELLRLTEKRVRDGLRAWPDGEAEAEGWVDDDGVDRDKPVRLHVRVIKRGDDLTVDYSETNDQVKGPINLGPAVSEASALVAVLAALDPTIPANDGARRAIRFVNPEGKITHPRWGAPVNNYFGLMTVLFNTVGKALADLNPGRAVGSHGFGLGAISVGYEKPRGAKPAVQYEIFPSSQGGTPYHDGLKGAVGMFNYAPNTPIEIIETEFAVRVRRFEWTRDTAGAGQYRGGPGNRKEYEMLGNATVTVRLAHQFKYGGWGVFGGKGPPTARAYLSLVGAEERMLRPLETVTLKPGDRFRIEMPGGGGYGDPRLRDPRMVLEDVLDGYVSLDAARDVYGVAIDPETWAVDEPETLRLRTEG